MEYALLSNEKSLNLSYNGLDTKDLSIITAFTLRDKLIHLNLSYNLIGPDGAKSLALLDFAHLQNLDLSFNQIGDKGVEYLTQNSKHKNLLSLDLKCNQIGPQGAFELSQSTNWNKLAILNTSFNKISTDGALCLIRNTISTEI